MARELGSIAELQTAEMLLTEKNVTIGFDATHTGGNTHQWHPFYHKNGMLCSCSQRIAWGNGKGLCAMSASQLYNIIWEGVEMLHTVGLCVRAFVSDGASTNRKFYDLCAKSNYYTTNPFAEGRIYFFAVTPHLLKNRQEQLRKFWRSQQNQEYDGEY